VRQSQHVTSKQGTSQHVTSPAFDERWHRVEVVFVGPFGVQRDAVDLQKDNRNRSDFGQIDRLVPSLKAFVNCAGGG
jgi:hypothetical protein